MWATNFFLSNLEPQRTNLHHLLSETVSVILFDLLQIVTTLLAGLPLKEDFEEAEPVYTCLLKMLDSPGLRGRVNSSLPGIVQALQAAVHQETIPIAQRQQLSSAMQPLNINQWYEKVETSLLG